MKKTSVIYFSDGLDEIETQAKVLPLAFPESAKKDVRKNISALTAGFIAKELNIFPFEALKEASKKIQKPKISEINLSVFAHFE